MVIGFTTTYAISVYHKKRLESEYRSLRGVLDTTLCDKVYQWLAVGRWFSMDTSVSSTIKTDSHDITEILFEVALSTLSLTKTLQNNKHYLAFYIICGWPSRPWSHHFH